MSGTLIWIVEPAALGADGADAAAATAKGALTGTGTGTALLASKRTTTVPSEIFSPTFSSFFQFIIILIVVQLP